MCATLCAMRMMFMFIEHPTIIHSFKQFYYCNYYYFFLLFSMKLILKNRILEKNQRKKIDFNSNVSISICVCLCDSQSLALANNF